MRNQGQMSVVQSQWQGPISQGCKLLLAGPGRHNVMILIRITGMWDPIGQKSLQLGTTICSLRQHSAQFSTSPEAQHDRKRLYSHFHNTTQHTTQHNTTQSHCHSRYPQPGLVRISTKEEPGFLWLGSTGVPGKWGSIWQQEVVPT